MKFGIKQIIRTFVTLALLGGLVLFVKNNFTEFTNLEINNFLPLGYMVFIIFLSLMAQGELLSVVLKPLKLNLSIGESTALSSITRVGNYLSFGYLGLAVRGYYLKKHYGLNYASFSSSVIAVYIVFFGASGILGLGSYLISVKDVAANLQLFFAAFIILLLSALAIAIPFNFRLKGESIHHASINTLFESWEKIRSEPLIVLRIFLTGAFTTLLFALLYYYEQRLFGVKSPFLPMILIAAVANLNSIFSITPAGIGVNEGLSIIAAKLVDIDPVIVVSGLLVRRVLVFVVSALVAFSISKKYLNLNASQILRFKARGFYDNT